VLPTPTFFYGAQPGEEINVTISPGKRLILRYLGQSPEPDAKGRRTVFFEINGTPRAMMVVDHSAATAGTARPVGTGAPGEVAAPMPGTVTGVSVAIGKAIEKGEALLTLEAMKMESTLYAETSGTVRAVHVKAGDAVDAKDLLLELELDDLT
jgi:pyruvate carboxylase